jgi:sigma-B regulation protein RsbU (phosphoserine phosphatase)
MNSFLNMPHTGIGAHLQNNPSGFLSVVPLAILLLDERGHLMDASPFARTMLGLGEVEGLVPWHQGVAHLPSDGLAAAVAAKLERGEGEPMVVWSPFETEAWSGRGLEVSAFRVASGMKDGQVLVFLREVPVGESARDKSIQQERVEEELRRERSWFEQLMNTLPDKIYFKDLESRFLRISQTQARQFGLGAPMEAMGKTDRDFFVASHAQKTRKEELAIIESGRPMVGQEQKITLHDGKELWASTTKVPLCDLDQKVIGTVGISRDITDRKLAEEALRAKKEEMETDLKMAYEVQKAFFTLDYPRFPAQTESGRETIRFGHRYLPVDTLGGDFFEIFPVSNSEAGILICDVMGHGVRAALITAFLRGFVDELKPLWRDPGALLTEINRGLWPILQQADSLMFVTMLYGVADVAREELRYANAGHPLPYLLRRAEGRVERIEPSRAGAEPAAGLINGFVYTNAREAMVKGDLALFFTDGLLEVEDAGGDFFGEGGLREVLEKDLGRASEDLLTDLVGAAQKHAGGEAFGDDVCLVTVDFPESA